MTSIRASCRYHAAMKSRLAALALAVFVATLGSSCRSIYYGTMEAFGVEKRDILVDRVEEGRDAQKEAKAEFKSALEAFKAATNFKGGELETTYDKLNGSYEASAEKAGAVGDKIGSIEKVSSDLFEEWQTEIDSMQNVELRAKSAAMRRDTKERCKALITAMRTAEKKMTPVLTAFHDHVLFLKHNLNAQAIASLQGSLAGIETDVTALVADMEKSIAEADAFIQQVQGKKP